MTPEDLARVWDALEAWDGARPRSIAVDGGLAQLYLGAMEIPLVALRPRPHVVLVPERVEGFGPVLTRLGLDLDCVTAGANYKLNRTDTGEYVARLLPDALKLHAGRVRALGPGAFREIAGLYLELPRAEPGA